MNNGYLLPYIIYELEALKRFSNSLNNGFGIEFHQQEGPFGNMLKGTRHNLNLKKDRSGRMRTERTQENINVFSRKASWKSNNISRKEWFGPNH